MRWLRRIGITLAGSAVAWLVTLLLVGWLGADCQRRKVEDRLASRMRATVTIGGLDLGLVTGHVGVDRIAIARDNLRLEVQRIDVDVLPLGLAIFQHGAGDVRIRGVTAQIAALAALDNRSGKGQPFEFDSMDIRDATVTFVVSLKDAGLSNLVGDMLGIGPVQIVLHVARAAAGHTVMRTALSWLFGLRVLDADVTLPGGAKVPVHYEGGRLKVGALEVTLTIPKLDAARELQQLRDIGIDVGTQIVALMLQKQPLFVPPEKVP
jgi:hypothetical protein